MRLIRLAALAVLTLLTTSLETSAQPPGKPACIGILWGAPPAFSPETTPPTERS